jgi:outer membrane protein
MQRHPRQPCPTTTAHPPHALSAPRFSVLAIAALLMAGAAHAQASDPARTRYSLGAVLVMDQDGYRDVGTDTLLVPTVSVQNKWVSLSGPQLDLRLVGDAQRSWWFGPRVEYRFDGYKASDGAVFNGMADRKGGLFYGVAGNFDLGHRFELAMDYVTAAQRQAGFERGAVGALSLRRTYQNGPWVLVPRFGVTYQSRSYVDYHYGVRLGEATATRPAYTGEGGWSPTLGLQVLYRASPRHVLFGNVGYQRHAKAVRDSPLMEASGKPQLVLGYQFVLN